MERDRKSPKRSPADSIGRTGNNLRPDGLISRLKKDVSQNADGLTGYVLVLQSQKFQISSGSDVLVNEDLPGAVREIPRDNHMVFPGILPGKCLGAGGLQHRHGLP